jgi:hypothetical protein
MATGSKKASPAVLEDPWMSVQEAARAVGMTRFKFLQFAMANRVESQITAGRTVVSRESVEKLARDLRKTA